MPCRAGKIEPVKTALPECASLTSPARPVCGRDHALSGSGVRHPERSGAPTMLLHGSTVAHLVIAPRAKPPSSKQIASSVIAELVLAGRAVGIELASALDLAAWRGPGTGRGKVLPGSCEQGAS